MLGEIGHILYRINGLVCDCGRRGCLQAYICINGLEQQAQMPMRRIISEATNNKQLKHILDEAVHSLAVSISNIRAPQQVWKDFDVIAASSVAMKTALFPNILIQEESIDIDSSLS